MTSQVQERPQEVIPQQLLDLQDFGQTGENLEDGAARNVLERRNINYFMFSVYRRLFPASTSPGPCACWQT